MKYQYFNSNILLLINSKGKIRKLYTPFRVRVQGQESGLTVKTIVYVEEVLCNDKDELLFSILGEIYSYKYFELIARF